jgi:hypothetical protein
VHHSLCCILFDFYEQATDSSPAGVALRREGKDLSSRLSKFKYQLAPFDIEEYKAAALQVSATLLLFVPCEQLNVASRSQQSAARSSCAEAASFGLSATKACYDDSTDTLLRLCMLGLVQSQRLNEKAARDDAQSKKLADARAEPPKKTEALHQAKLSAQVSTYASLMKLLCNAVFCSPQFMSSSQCVTLTMLRVTCMPTRQHWLTEAGG